MVGNKAFTICRGPPSSVQPTRASIWGSAVVGSVKVDWCMVGSGQKLCIHNCNDLSSNTSGRLS